MMPPIASPAITPDHVSLASGADALMYVGAVALWLAGVVAVVVYKIRAA